MAERSASEYEAEIDRLVVERISDTSGLMRRDAFVAVTTELLTGDGTLDDISVCFLRTVFGNRHVEVNGYDIAHDGTALNLVVAEYGAAGQSVRRDRVDRAIRRATAFAEFVRRGLHTQLERSSPAFDMAERIHASWSEVERIRIVVVTDGVVGPASMPSVEAAGLPAVIDVWDVVRLGRLALSGREQEEIVIDLVQRGHVVPCVKSSTQAGGYRCVLAVVPGTLLAQLYDEFHGRLLQRNVRAFLQVRGKINKNIFETIKNQPGNFLAYNNGISATATGADIGAGPDGQPILRRIRDLQIVNGGQTTASLHYAAGRGADLTDIHVPAKITIVAAEQLDSLVPSISRYANSQNAVNLADFEGSSPFHIGLETLSRSIWAPAAHGSTIQTRWYYERVRGQYEVDRSNAGTVARRKAFDRENPRPQRFSKTEIAQFEFAFQGSPHIVCLGAQKCFQQWTVQNETINRERPQATYFRRLVGKALLFNGVDRIVRTPRSGGYYLQTTAYTAAIVASSLGEALDLETLWRVQDLPSALLAELAALAERVRETLVTPPAAANITEWCKKEVCWDDVRRRVRWAPPPSVLVAFRS
ncbi:AIPR family protein [Frankia sp. Cj3]|uniref:AIPR family protein n=1 Tax=Frankia sp. Cj3 TaxID=2880976 RepID=UPI001EF72A2D|nr:AIPR family protein [Frankia sp. Cj3]